MLPGRKAQCPDNHVADMLQSQTKVVGTLELYHASPISLINVGKYRVFPSKREKNHLIINTESGRRGELRVPTLLSGTLGCELAEASCCKPYTAVTSGEAHAQAGREPKWEKSWHMDFKFFSVQIKNHMTSESINEPLEKDDITRCLNSLKYVM